MTRGNFRRLGQLEDELVTTLIYAFDSPLNDAMLRLPEDAKAEERAA
jgi:hypothetical protein